MSDYSMTIGGQAVSGTDSFAVLNPATGDVTARAPECTRDELDRAMGAGQQAQAGWQSDAAARRAGLTDITAAGNHIRFAPVELPDSRQVRVQRLYPKTVVKPAVRTMLIPVPKTAPIGGQPLRDTELLAWSGQVIRSVLADMPGAAT